MSKDPGAKAPVAPPRNNFKSSVLYKNSRATELQGRDPDFVYEYFPVDPKQPSYIEKKLREHEIGNPSSGFATVGPWEVVHSQSDTGVRAYDPRTDQGKPVDTTISYGTQKLCRIHKDEYAKYKLVEDAKQAAWEKQIYSPDRTSDGKTALTSIVSKDENANQFELLRQSGHPMPGSGS